MTSILSGGDVDEPQDVALRALRHRQHARRAPRRQRDRRPRVGERQPVRQVLRKHQVDAVVDRHDRPARHERRQHVVRRVKQRDAFAPERQRDLRTARRASSCRRVSATARKFSPSDASASRSSGRQSSTNSVSLVEPRQLPQQVPDVGADAEVVQLAGVDADPHGSDDTRRAGGLELGHRASTAYLPTAPARRNPAGTLSAGHRAACRDRRRPAARLRRRRSRRRECRVGHLAEVVEVRRRSRARRRPACAR